MYMLATIIGNDVPVQTRNHMMFTPVLIAISIATHYLYSLGLPSMCLAICHRSANINEGMQIAWIQATSRLAQGTY